jgi:Fe-S cluster assembly iron-binding protein IscA
VKVRVTDEAARLLAGRKPEMDAVLRISAMNEGCGCGADLLFEMGWDRPLPDDERHFAGELVVALDRHSAQYLEPEVTIDVEDGGGTFVLRSDQEIFLNHIRL